MYEQIKKLVEENKLSFADEHTPIARKHLESDKDYFLERVKYNLDMSLYSKNIPIFSDETCSSCGMNLRYYLKGDQLVPHHIDRETLDFVPSTTTCYREEEVVVDIPVPSGELIFADWFEHGNEMFDHVVKENYENLSLKIKVNKTKEYAKEGFGHFFVGNTSPVVFKKENKLIIGHTRFDDENYEKYEESDDWEGYESSPEDGAEEMGRVLTDRWWVCMCDRTIYEQLAIKKFGETKGKEMTEDAVQDVKRSHVSVQVEPGLYRLRYFTAVDDDTIVHATLEKIS